MRFNRYDIFEAHWLFYATSHGNRMNAVGFVPAAFADRPDEAPNLLTPRYFPAHRLFLVRSGDPHWIGTRMDVLWKNLPELGDIQSKALPEREGLPLRRLMDVTENNLTPNGKAIYAALKRGNAFPGM